MKADLIILFIGVGLLTERDLTKEQKNEYAVRQVVVVMTAFSLNTMIRGKV